MIILKKMAGKMKDRINLIVLDIDGVLTDGKVFIDSYSKEYKFINYRDLDGVNYIRGQGIEFALLTGEDTKFVDIIARRFKIKNIIKGAKNKAEGIHCLSKLTRVPVKNICYVGDSDRDEQALKIAGMSFAPKDATRKARKAACRVLSLRGGEGVIQEIKEYFFHDEK